MSKKDKDKDKGLSKAIQPIGKEISLNTRSFPSIFSSSPFKQMWSSSFKQYNDKELRAVLESHYRYFIKLGINEIIEGILQEYQAVKEITLLPTVLTKIILEDYLGYINKTHLLQIVEEIFSFKYFNNIGYSLYTEGLYQLIPRPAEGDQGLSLEPSVSSSIPLWVSPEVSDLSKRPLREPDEHIYDFLYDKNIFRLKSSKLSQPNLLTRYDVLEILKNPLTTKELELLEGLELVTELGIEGRNLIPLIYMNIIGSLYISIGTQASGPALHQKIYYSSIFQESLAPIYKKNFVNIFEQLIDNEQQLELALTYIQSALYQSCVKNYGKDFQVYSTSNWKLVSIINQTMEDLLQNQDYIHIKTKTEIEELTTLPTFLIEIISKYADTKTYLQKKIESVLPFVYFDNKGYYSYKEAADWGIKKNTFTFYPPDTPLDKIPSYEKLALIPRIDWVCYDGRFTYPEVSDIPLYRSLLDGEPLKTIGDVGNMEE